MSWLASGSFTLRKVRVVYWTEVNGGEVEG